MVACLTALVRGRVARNICYFFKLVVAWALADLPGRTAPSLDDVSVAFSSRHIKDRLEESETLHQQAQNGLLTCSRRVPT
jgi:hypothetical protein